MTDFLFHLGALSLGGGLVGLVLMATGLLTRSRYAARWRCWGWLLLCLRLAIPLPFSFPNVQVRAPIQLTSPSLERPSELPFTAGRPSGCGAFSCRPHRFLQSTTGFVLSHLLFSG